MKIRHMIAFALFVLTMPTAAYAQARQVICLPGTNPNTGNNTCVDLTAANPLPITGTMTLPAGAATSALQSSVGATAHADAATINTTLGSPLQAGGTVLTKPTALTIVPLDISTVTTGGTAVTALTAGHRSAGGFLQNPIGATIALCINEQGTASGTTSAGATTCIQPGQTYTLAPSAGPVSVITSDSSHPFSGEGLN